MTKHLMLAATVALGALASTPVVADWETTRWGMSPDDGLAALDGASSHDPAPAEIYQEAGLSYAPRVKLSQAVEGIAGEVSLLFDAEDKLHFVLFNPADIASCDGLGVALIDRHGEADEPGTGTGAFSISTWVVGSDEIKLTNVPTAGICNLSYSAI